MIFRVTINRDEFNKLRMTTLLINHPRDEAKEIVTAAFELMSDIDSYGLGREQTAFVLDDFHRVRNPRRMTRECFSLVLDHFDRLE